jgi:hypothetical protein
MARPKKELPWDFIDDHLRAQCDGVAIASLLDMHPDTFYRAVMEKHGIGFTEYSRTKKTEGKELLRKKQFESAMGGDKTMLVWLGKQYLEQKERVDHTSKDDKLGVSITVANNQAAEGLGYVLGNESDSETE